MLRYACENRLETDSNTKIIDIAKQMNRPLSPILNTISKYSVCFLRSISMILVENILKLPAMVTLLIQTN